MDNAIEVTNAHKDIAIRIGIRIQTAGRARTKPNRHPSDLISRYPLPVSYHNSRRSKSPKFRNQNSGDSFYAHSLKKLSLISTHYTFVVPTFAVAHSVHSSLRSSISFVSQKIDSRFQDEPPGSAGTKGPSGSLIINGRKAFAAGSANSTDVTAEVAITRRHTAKRNRIHTQTAGRTRVIFS